MFAKLEEMYNRQHRPKKSAGVQSANKSLNMPRPLPPDTFIKVTPFEYQTYHTPSSPRRHSTNLRERVQLNSASALDRPATVRQHTATVG